MACDLIVKCRILDDTHDKSGIIACFGDITTSYARFIDKLCRCYRFELALRKTHFFGTYLDDKG